MIDNGNAEFHLGIENRKATAWQIIRSSDQLVEVTIIGENQGAVDRCISAIGENIKSIKPVRDDWFYVSNK